MRQLARGPVLFFLNHPAPTEIYTLSLHDLFRSMPAGLGIDPIIHFCISADLYIRRDTEIDRKSTRLNSSHGSSSYAVFWLKKNSSARCRSVRPRKTGR